MSKKDATDLLNRYRNGQVSEEEKALVESWYLNYTQKAADPEISDLELEANQHKILDHIMAGIEPERKFYYWRYISVAAAVVAVIFAGGLLLKENSVPDKVSSLVIKPGNNHLPPGGNRATLILSNGSSINLTGVKNGALASEKGVVINKNADGRITYGHGKGNAESATVFNTVLTPRGGQYQLVLSDGTRVWLNSASSLKFPVTFTAAKREVELSGEAYFEVAHNQHKPFQVVSNGQTVEVLGTHFNINAYQDEQATKTTLLEGSVKVLAHGVSSKIKPGEQVQQKNGKLTVSEVDLEEAIAWKNGFFYFKDDNIKTIMRQLSRWYDVEIKYEGQIPEREFSGQMNKNIDASQLMHILSIEKIHYRLENRTIVIIP
jgi:ferric-dicitrate binding protein FerR (iron transport regulator)